MFLFFHLFGIFLLILAITHIVETKPTTTKYLVIVAALVAMIVTMLNLSRDDFAGYKELLNHFR